jgi:hypothetical protein
MPPPAVWDLVARVSPPDINTHPGVIVLMEGAAHADQQTVVRDLKQAQTWPIAADLRFYVCTRQPSTGPTMEIMKDKITSVKSTAWNDVIRKGAMLDASEHAFLIIDRRNKCFYRHSVALPSLPDIQTFLGAFASSSLAASPLQDTSAEEEHDQGDGVIPSRVLADDDSDGSS